MSADEVIIQYKALCNTDTQKARETAIYVFSIRNYSLNFMHLSEKKY